MKMEKLTEQTQRNKKEGNNKEQGKWNRELWFKKIEKTDKTKRWFWKKLIKWIDLNKMDRWELSRKEGANIPTKGNW